MEENKLKYTMVLLIIILIVWIAAYFLWWKKRDGQPCDFSPHKDGALSEYHGKYLGGQCIPASAYDTQMQIRNRIMNL